MTDRQIALKFKKLEHQYCCLKNNSSGTLYTSNSPTVLLSGTGTESDPLIATEVENPKVGVFYVNKSYTGIGEAIVVGYSSTEIGSDNPSYTAVLEKAVMGDIERSFPCPWSARNAALDAISAGTIAEAQIVILHGTWTYGSVVPEYNGNSSGNSSINEVPDLAFSGTGDFPSLLKNNLYYYWFPGTGLKGISKTIAYHIGYSNDVTPFKSGFYGNGDFTTIYGTLEGLSQRFIEINNPYAEVIFEADTTTMQRAWFYLFNYKRINVHIKNWIGSLQDSLIYEQGQNADGDGTESTLYCRVDNLQLGHKYFPYPSTTVPSFTRSMIYLNGAQDGNTRPKYKKYDIGTALLETVGGWGTLVSTQGSEGKQVINQNFELNINYLKQEFYNGNNAGAGGLITLYTSGTGLRQNNNFIINIGKADTQVSLFDPRTNLAANASNVNNNVIFNIGNIRRSGTATGYTELMNCTLSLPVGDTVGEKPKFEFNIGKAEANTGYVFGETGFTGYNYCGKTTITGMLISNDTSATIYLHNGSYSTLLKDCIFYHLQIKIGFRLGNLYL